MILYRRLRGHTPHAGIVLSCNGFLIALMTAEDVLELQRGMYGALSAGL
jgi:hypothetical protein